MTQTITIQQVKDALKINERMIRKLLNDAGAEPRLDEYIENLEETVTRDTVINLYAIRAGDLGPRLSPLLNATR